MDGSAVIRPATPAPHDANGLVQADQPVRSPAPSSECVTGGRGQRLRSSCGTVTVTVLVATFPAASRAVTVMV